jgi:hypothetical protein
MCYDLRMDLKTPKRRRSETLSQRDRFIKASREHEASEDPEAFERVFAKIVPAKTGKPPKTPKT